MHIFGQKCRAPLKLTELLRLCRRAPQRGPRKHSRGALLQPRFVGTKLETSTGRKHGDGVSSRHLIKDLGKHRKLPQQILARKWILWIFEVRKKPFGTTSILSIILAAYLGNLAYIIIFGKKCPLSPSKKKLTELLRLCVLAIATTLARKTRDRRGG